MRTILQRSVHAFLVAVCLAGYAIAQEPAGRQPTSGEEPRESWYYQGPVYRADARAIVQQKAQARAMQREARLASLAWYGMSNGRPTASPTPFTSLYSPVWQQPGGRPFAWYTSSQPTYIIYAR